MNVGDLERIGGSATFFRIHKYSVTPPGIVPGIDIGGTINVVENLTIGSRFFKIHKRIRNNLVFRNSAGDLLFKTPGD